MNSDKILTAIKIIRPVNAAITFFTSIVASFICLNQGSITLPAYLAALCAALTVSAGNIINDIKDIEADKINHPDRALPSGIFTINYAFLLYASFTIASLIISYNLSFILFAINASVTILLLLYSFWFKKQGLAGNILIAFLTGLVFIFGALAVNVFYYALIPAFFAFVINLIRELVKDIEDIDGDIKFGIITFPSKHGVNKTITLLTYLSISILFLSIIPFILGIYKIYYGVIILLLFDPLLVYFVWRINKNAINLSLNKMSFLLKLSMIIGVIAVYLGR